MDRNMEKYQPLVSIIIPVYNGSNFMSEAIESALNQTYRNIEVLVINDGSEDNGETEKIAQSYGDNIRYFSKSNGGVSSALNLGIKNMRGEYFSWLSHDDVYMPEKIEFQVNALAKLEDKKILIYCESMQIDKNSKAIMQIKRKRILKKNETENCNNVLMILLNQGTFNGCCFLIHKDVFNICGNFDETLRYNQDSFMWYKIFLNKFSLHYLPDVCVKSRVHDKQLTQTRKDLFHKDCEATSHFLIPEFTKISTKEENFLLAYVKSNAKHANHIVVQNGIKIGKQNKLFNFIDLVNIKKIQLYGRIRPFIRYIYYKLFRRIKTKR